MSIFILEWKVNKYNENLIIGQNIKKVIKFSSDALSRNYN